MGRCRGDISPGVRGREPRRVAALLEKQLGHLVRVRVRGKVRVRVRVRVG